MKSALALLIALAALPVVAAVNAPDWVKTAAATPVPATAANAKAVVLYDDTTVTVDGATITTHRRRVAKVLTSEGTDIAKVVIWLNPDTKLRDLHGWSVTSRGTSEVRDRDAVETAAFDNVYEDLRLKMLSIPAEAGTFVAWEYELRERPVAMETTWHFQTDVPVVQTTFSLSLPRDWTWDAQWRHHDEVAPPADGRLTWTLRDVPAIADEPRMPSPNALAGRAAFNFASANPAVSKRRSWGDVARWYAALAEPSCGATPQLQSRVRSLVASNAPLLDRVRALASFVQHDVRYVAVEIGIGGYKPHSAAQVFTNRYGDCKDKVTLLRTMLRESGIESQYVLVNTTRGAVDPAFATASAFDHAIIAIRVPAGTKLDRVYSVVDHPRLGTLFIFDPTSTYTPPGQLPEELQKGRGLLVAADDGELIELPAAPPSVNQLNRRAKLKLDESGLLTGEVEEVRTGTIAAGHRAALQSLNEKDRITYVESLVAAHVADFSASDVKFENLADDKSDLIVRYKVALPRYATHAGNMILVRPRVVGTKPEAIVDAEHRRFDYVTDGPSQQSDDIEITVPSSLRLGELPPKVSLASDVVRYESASQFAAGVLHYARRYTMQAFSVPPSKIAELNRAFTRIAADERAKAVFLESQ